jgi:hypothetical protein
VDGARRATEAQKALKGRSFRAEGPERPEFPRTKAKSLIETLPNYIIYYLTIKIVAL